MRTTLASVRGALPPLNPVLARELKQRMRGRLTWLVVTGYLAILALILRFVYLGASQSLSGNDFGNPLASASVGRSIFQWLLFFMLMLVCFIVPGLTASAISGERERQTLISLQVTLLRARSIVLGKVLSSLAFTAFLVVASLPLLSVPFLVGGVSASEVVKGVVMVLLTAVVLACLAVACSALLRRTQAATVFAYGITAALTVGTLIVYGGQRAMDGPIERASPAILALNPFVATADVVQGRNQENSFESPFSVLSDLVRPDSFAFAVDGGMIEPGIKGIPPMPMPVPMPMPAPPDTVAVPFGAEANVPATTIPAPEAAVASDLPLPDLPVSATVSARSEIQIFRTDPVAGQVLIDPGDGSFVPEAQPRAEVLGMRLWVAWLVMSIIVGGLALFLAVRKVSLPSARDSS